MDFNGSGTVTARYLSDPRAVDAVLARETTGGVVAWYIADRLGTVRDIVNSSGAVIDHVDYTAFGTATDSSPSNGDRFKYAGMELDAATGLYYDRARWYDAISERYINQDMIEFLSGDADMYRYAGNNPANLVDHTGLDDEPPSGPIMIKSNLPQITDFSPIVPTGGMLIDPNVFPEIDRVISRLFNDSNSGKKDWRETGIGVYFDNKTGDISFGPEILGDINVPVILFGEPGNLPRPKGKTLICTIHVHPATDDPNRPSIADPRFSPLDPQLSKGAPAPGHRPVPWIVVGPPTKPGGKPQIFLIGPPVWTPPPTHRLK